MTYIPNVVDAFAVYMIAVAYVDDIPLKAFAPPELMNVKELHIKGEFYIWDTKELDKHGRYIEPLAACTYDKHTRTWTVELIGKDLLKLSDVGDVWNPVALWKMGKWQILGGSRVEDFFSSRISNKSN